MQDTRTEVSPLTDHPALAALAEGQPEARALRPGGAKIARLLLGSQLRRLREAAGIELEAAAHHIRGSLSKISRMETGKTGFRERDLRDLLALYRISDAQVIESMLDLARQANTQAWWATYGDVLPHWFEPYLGLEAAAETIRAFDLQFVNGLLQTEDYAWAVFSLGLRTASAPEISRRVAVRIRRQQLLTTPGGPRLWAIIDENALRRPVGGPGVMRGQLARLTEVAELPNVTIQVIPFDAGAHDAAGGSFTLLRFAEPQVPDVVYLEQLTTASYLDKPADRDRYLDIINRIAATALSPAASVAFIRQLLDSLPAGRSPRPSRPAYRS
jgi:transcriptional regulator with XRE-family HTH domain